MVNLLRTQSWHAVVRGGPATATWHGGDTPARATRCTEALPCAASKKSGHGETVGARWSNAGGEGATRCELGGRQGNGGDLSLLRAEAKAKEEAGGEMSARERTGERWRGCWRVVARHGLTGWAIGIERPQNDDQALASVGH